MADHKLGAAATLLKDGQTMRVELEGAAVMLARAGGQYYAIGAACSHYGGPLHEGVLRDHTVMCPWHHACFDIRSGARLEPPALNDVPHYPVRIEDGQVVVTLPQDNTVEPEGAYAPADPRVFAIIGGGAAGNAAAEELRRSGFRGKVVIFSDSPDVPVDRPNLSKDYLSGHAQPSWVPLRGDSSWYAARGIELYLNTRVVRIDPKAHTITLENGRAPRYDKLLLATGGIPRRLTDVPGGELGGIFPLRSLADANQIIAAAKSGKQVMIIGSNFLGLEVAAALAGGYGNSVTVVAPEAVPFAAILGEEIGRMFSQEQQANGVQFRQTSGVAQFIGKNSRVEGVELKGGGVLPADFVVLGVGVRPATDFLRGSGLLLDEKDRAVRVNAHLQSSDPDIYAAGDIARWDNGTTRGERIEHWRVAEQQGIIAARNMLAGPEAEKEDMNRHVPFFWVNQWSITLNYVGHTATWDEIIYRGGRPADKRFMAFYVRAGKLVAAAACGYDREMTAVEFILRDGLPLSASQIRDETFNLVDYAATAQR